MERNKKECPKCGRKISLSNFDKHLNICKGHVKKSMFCEYCENKHDGTYGSGRFCSVKCARGFSTKEKRSLINEKVSKTMSGRGHQDVELICEYCKKEFEVYWSKRYQKFCSNKCAARFKVKDPIYIKKLSNSLKKAYKPIEARKRLRDIGRKGGFGKKGYTKNGTRYESLFEKGVFEWLENNNINFEAHKPIPNSAKISDIYIFEQDLWIELDGINREKKKEWLKEDYIYWKNKLKLYEKQKLKYKIYLTLEDFQNDFIKFSKK